MQNHKHHMNAILCCNFRLLLTHQICRRIAGASCFKPHYENQPIWWVKIDHHPKTLLEVDWAIKNEKKYEWKHQQQIPPISLKKQHQSAMTRCLLVGPRCSKAAAFQVDLHMPQTWLLHTATTIMHISVKNLEASLVKIQQIVRCKTHKSMKTSTTNTNPNHSIVHSTCDNWLQ
jgi:hypothetical protein